MIETISLCNTCYKKVPALIFNRDGKAMMWKKCDVHGEFESIVDPSFMHVSNFYQHGTMGNNNSIIVHIENECNMKCSWCYYGKTKIETIQFLDQLLREQYKGFSLMFSGGEPTIRPDYIDLVKDAFNRGWHPSTITNMIKLADDDFFKQTLNEAFIDRLSYRFALSFQHPKNYSKEILDLKVKALHNIEKEKLKASCLVFSIQSLDELDFIKEFYDETKHLYHLLRIRTMFCNWKNKIEKDLYLSDLHSSFMDKFGEYTPVQYSGIEQSNIYCLYMQTKEGRHVSLSSAPTVENLDYNICSRPVYMLGPDYRCYPVPIAQVISEGISKNWKDGFQIKEA